MNTSDVDIKVVSFKEKDGVTMEEIDITINDAGNCNGICLRYIF